MGSLQVENLAKTLLVDSCCYCIKKFKGKSNVSQ